MIKFVANKEESYSDGPVKESASILDIILSPVDSTEFLSEYFFKRSLYIKGWEGKFDWLCTKNQVLEKAHHSDSVKICRPGRRDAILSKEHVGFEQGNTFFKDALAQGAQICVTGIEGAHAYIASNLSLLKTQLNYPYTISLRGYISPENVGTRMHYDPRAVTTLQLSGRKQWWYGSTPLDVMPGDNNSPSRRLPDTKELNLVILEPGDVLAVPPGAVHQTIALSESWSVNLSFEYLR